MGGTAFVNGIAGEAGLARVGAAYSVKFISTGVAFSKGAFPLLQTDAVGITACDSRVVVLATGMIAGAADGGWTVLACNREAALGSSAIFTEGEGN